MSELPIVPRSEAMTFDQAAELTGFHAANIRSSRHQVKWGLERCQVDPPCLDARRRFFTRESVRRLMARLEADRKFITGSVSALALPVE
jgi:hypothetical protein